MKQDVSNMLVANSHDLAQEMQWLHQLIDGRIKLYFADKKEAEPAPRIEAPDLRRSESLYARFLRDTQLNREERIVLLLALAPHICPWVLDPFLVRNEANQRGFTEFGGIRGVYHSGFIPTGETAAFIIAAENLTHRFIVQEIFSLEHIFYKNNILRLEKEKSEEPFLSGALTISKEYLSHFTSGTPYHPPFSNEFPAQRLTTNLDWDDLVLEDEILDDLDEIKAWLRHQDAIMDEMGLRKHLKPGFRSLFYGPPGTGKTLAVCLLGKSSDQEVYRVDISKVVSKYIGETEKNLANIFDQAANKNWILFFDEADAIFGKRTATKDAKDRYANQEVAYLLQRIEDYAGLVILASNLKSNIDEAFARRFQSVVFFPMPRPELRLELWRKMFAKLHTDKNVDFKKIAQDFELSGGAMINVLRYCAIKSFERPDHHVTRQDILNGIRREFRKEGKTI